MDESKSSTFLVDPYLGSSSWACPQHRWSLMPHLKRLLLLSGRHLPGASKYPVFCRTRKTLVWIIVENISTDLHIQLSYEKEQPHRTVQNQCTEKSTFHKVTRMTLSPPEMETESKLYNLVLNIIIPAFISKCTNNIFLIEYMSNN